MGTWLGFGWVAWSRLVDSCCGLWMHFKVKCWGKHDSQNSKLQHVTVDE